ncbi:electron transfer flavoprotein beta subunit lysine methyltransferase-like [Ruditapes philippinarum]|uniref:electron transfer flavoprotein beta subunit lysine methyltransferase-like n=1 Tax=Ruditapes philippinarum TaxID=129788 RepID=UPI00295BE4D1|nr:electron transfer flavoprotein beta subunit lysine methyltransferase-like [Ruditapes philippinarum]
MKFLHQPQLARFYKSLDVFRFSKCGCATLDNLIAKNTELTRDHMTPEVALRLITKRCPLWKCRPDDSAPFSDPFWAFYWPGGQVLTRYILDNPAIFNGATVLDVGSGCGASAIACVMCGAENVIANDVDPVAIRAIQLNSAANRVTVQTSRDNMIGQLNSEWSTVLLGDMFYDEEFRDSLVEWTTNLFSKFKTNVFIGDPGRLPFLDHPIRKRLTKVAEYDLDGSCKEENNGLSTGYVWKLDR